MSDDKAGWTPTHEVGLFQVPGEMNGVVAQQRVWVNGDGDTKLVIEAVTAVESRKL